MGKAAVAEQRTALRPRPLLINQPATVPRYAHILCPFPRDFPPLATNRQQSFLFYASFHSTRKSIPYFIHFSTCNYEESLKIFSIKPNFVSISNYKQYVKFFRRSYAENCPCFISSTCNELRRIVEYFPLSQLTSSRTTSEKIL